VVVLKHSAGAVNRGESCVRVFSALLVLQRGLFTVEAVQVPLPQHCSVEWCNKFCCGKIKEGENVPSGVQNQALMLNQGQAGGSMKPFKLKMPGRVPGLVAWGFGTMFTNTETHAVKGGV